MGPEHPEDSGKRDDAAEIVDAAGRKWKVLRLAGMLSLTIGTVLFVVLFSLQPQHAKLLFDVSTWLFLAGFILYVIGRLGSW